MISNCTIEDFSSILKLYASAREVQREKAVVQWPEFKESMIQQEIAAKQQWKIQIGDQVACVWAIAENDVEIWQEKSKEPAIYIHRIATSPTFRGRNFVKHILHWSKQFAAVSGKKFIRMDTVGKNVKLIQYYEKCGFEFLGYQYVGKSPNLPEHYHDATVSLFQAGLS